MKFPSPQCSKQASLRAAWPISILLLPAFNLDRAIVCMSATFQEEGTQTAGPHPHSKLKIRGIVPYCPALKPKLCEFRVRIYKISECNFYKHVFVLINIDG